MLTLSIIVAIAAAAPAPTPLDETGDLLVLDQGSGSILQIGEDGSVSVALDRASIRDAVGSSPDFSDSGIAVLPDGTVAFSEGGSESLMLWSGDGVLSSLGSFEGVEGLALGSDDALYVIESSNDRVWRVDLDSGESEVWLTGRDVQEVCGGKADFDAGIIGGPDGSIYVLSSSEANCLVEVSAEGEVDLLHQGAPLDDPDQFLARAADGSLVLDNAEQSIVRVTLDGEVSQILTPRDVSEALGEGVGELDCGLAYDDAGDLFLGDSDRGDLLRLSADGTLELFVASAAMQAVTGSHPSLGAGIVFVPPGWEASSGGGDGGSEDGGSEDGGSEDGGSEDGGSEDGGAEDGSNGWGDDTPYDDDDGDNDDSKGCATAPVGGGLLIALLGLVRRRRSAC